MNATANTCTALRDILSKLVVTIERDFLALESLCRTLHGDPAERDADDSDISLCSQIADYERDVNEGGASAEAIKTALMVLDGYNANAEGDYEAIWTMREQAWRLNSEADQVLWIEDI
jgi:hypothetical protein